MKKTSKLFFEDSKVHVPDYMGSFVICVNQEKEKSIAKKDYRVIGSE